MRTPPGRRRGRLLRGRHGRGHGPAPESEGRPSALFRPRSTRRSHRAVLAEWLYSTSGCRHLDRGHGHQRGRGGHQLGRPGDAATRSATEASDGGSLIHRRESSPASWSSAAPGAWVPYFAFCLSAMTSARRRQATCRPSPSS
jgi:hypothetical protein